MNPSQRAACASRLPVRERLDFLALMDEADRLVARAWQLRADAWSIYRAFNPGQSKSRKVRL